VCERAVHARVNVATGADAQVCRHFLHYYWGRGLECNRDFTSLLLQAPKADTAEFDALFGGASAEEGQEENPRIVAVRSAYHRAVQVPTAQLETLWRGYEVFEGHSGNKVLGKRLLEEWRPKYVGGEWAARGMRVVCICGCMEVEVARGLQAHTCLGLTQRDAAL
jgi:hypothetical protein